MSNSLWPLHMPGFPVLLHLLELAQTHVHWAGDAIQPFHSLLPPSPPALNLSQHQGLFPSGSNSKIIRLQCKRLQIQFLGSEDPLEKGMAIHSSILAWRIPWTEDPGRLQSMGLQSQTWLSDFTFTLRICCTAQRIEPIFYNNYTWSMTFKSCESLYCIPETSIIL